MLELYNAPQSTCSQKVRLTLAEKGLEFVEHKLKLFQNDQLKPEYLKLKSKRSGADVGRRRRPDHRFVGDHGISRRAVPRRFR